MPRTVEIPAELADVPPVERVSTHVQTFLFSAATWNPHRIHYDRDYAMSEGYRDILVQSHLHACFVSEALLRVVGNSGRLVRFGWQNRGIACPGDRMIISGRAVSATETVDGVRLDYELEERGPSGELLVSAWAWVLLPAPESTPASNAADSSSSEGK
jgi:hypothetical protein